MVHHMGGARCGGDGIVMIEVIVITNFQSKKSDIAHLLELFLKLLTDLDVPLFTPTLISHRLAQSLCQMLRVGVQSSDIPLQLPHMTLPLRLASLQLQPQIVSVLLQLLQQGCKDVNDDRSGSDL